MGNNISTISKEEYYPYGETSFGSYTKKRYRYTGKERDEESGLYYYGARYYSAWVGRFVSVDPLAAETPHFASYVYGNAIPLIFNDPSGMKAEEGGGGGDSWGLRDASFQSGRDDVGIENGGLINLPATGSEKGELQLLSSDITSNETDNVNTYAVTIEVKFGQVKGEHIEFGVTTTYNDAPDATGVLIKSYNLDTGEQTERVIFPETPMVIDKRISIVKPAKTLSEILYDIGLKMDRINQSYQGEEGFKKLGEDLTKTSTIVKAGGVVVAFYNPVLGWRIYNAGSAMSTSSDIISAINEFNNEDYKDGAMTSIKIVLGVGAGSLIKSKTSDDLSRRLGIQVIVDQYIDSTFNQYKNMPNE